MFLVFTSCNEEKLDYYNPSVDLFVKQLKAGTYNTRNDVGIVDIPLFSAQHIPELLEYVEDMTEIPSFPLPTISSQVGGRARLGECMLWVIESIRLGYPASLGCKLVKREADNYEGIYFLTNEEVLEVVKSYRHWWDTTRSLPPYLSVHPFGIDPLWDSPYRWW